jgi:hypothetical protein
MNDKDYNSDEVFSAPLFAGELSRILGRIEATLTDMRRDIQEGTRAQANFTTRLETMDKRVAKLEGADEARKSSNRMLGMILVVILVPTLNVVWHIHGWINRINEEFASKEVHVQPPPHHISRPRP